MVAVLVTLGTSVAIIVLTGQSEYCYGAHTATVPLLVTDADYTEACELVAGLRPAYLEGVRHGTSEDLEFGESSKEDDTVRMRAAVTVSYDAAVKNLDEQSG
jgi:hypothetical protein